MHGLAVYLQKASLKAVGLLSREKAMVIPWEDHLRGKRDTKWKEHNGKIVKSKGEEVE